VRLEPPGPDVSPGISGRHLIQARPLRAAADLSPVRFAAAVATVLLVATSSGDVLLLGVLLGVTTGSVVGGAAAVLAGVAALVRWGVSSLDALSGAQAVLGAAGAVGPVVAALSAWLAAAAVVGTAPARDRVAAVAVGIAAAVHVAGPHGRVGLRLAASLLGVLVALLVARWRATESGARLNGWPAVAAGALAVLLAAIS